MRIVTPSSTGALRSRISPFHSIAIAARASPSPIERAASRPLAPFSSSSSVPSGRETFTRSRYRGAAGHRLEQAQLVFEQARDEKALLHVATAGAPQLCCKPGVLHE